MRKPLCVDLYCGLGGWTEGFLAEGYTVIGFDNHRHEYGEAKYPGQLVIQDVLTLHGSQFRNATVIVASPPCQNYSYLAMPWSRSSDPNNSKAAKALRLKWETEGPDNRLFDACFRIQREAIEATGTTCPECAGSGIYEERLANCDKRDWPCEACKGIGAINTRYIPLIVENVRGAQPWVGRSAWNYGSFHLWGDVPALMPTSLGIRKRQGRNFHTHALTGGAVSSPSFHGAEHETRGVGMGSKNNGGSWFNVAHNTTSGTGRNPVHDEAARGTKIGGDWFSDPKSTCRKHGSRSNARKAASAQIAKIPFPLSNHIARVYTPRSKAVA